MSSPDDCYVDQTGIIGGGDGNPFTLSQVTSGKMLTNLQFWRDSQTIRGVRMTYNTGESILRGSSDDNPDNYGMIDIALDDRITKFTMLDNGKISGRLTLGRVLIETSSGLTFNFGVDGGTVPYTQDVHSGILAGIVGADGTEIDRSGLLFLKSVRSVQINISNDGGWSPNPDGSPQYISPDPLDVGSYQNGSNSPYPWRLQNSVFKTWSAEYTQTATRQWGTESNFRAGIFQVHPVNAIATWVQSSETATSSSTTGVAELSWDIGGTLEPKQIIKATASTFKGMLDIGYESDVVVTMDSGDTFEYKESGQFKNVQYSPAIASYEVVSAA